MTLNLHDSKHYINELKTVINHQNMQLIHYKKLHKTDCNQWSQYLHDDIGQGIAAIKSLAQCLQLNIDKDSEQYELSELIKQTSAELYQGCYDLMRGINSVLEISTNPLDNIESCLKNSRASSHGIDTEIQIETSLTQLPLVINMLISRSFQDTLSQLIRSNSPCDVSVSLNYQSDHKNCIELKISVSYKDCSSIDISSDVFMHNKQLVDSVGGNYVIQQDSCDFLFISIILNIEAYTEDSL